MKTMLMTKFNTLGAKARRYSPEILAVGGTIGVVASFVLGCRATTKVSEILEESKKNVEQIHYVADSEEYADKYSKEDAKKDLAIVYAQTGMKLVKLYAPSVILGVASIGCLLTSNNILRRRNVALAAAYATLNKGFKEYRGRVVERFGDAVDRELKYNLKSQKITETVIDPETGKEKKEKKTVDVINPEGLSGYARCFDETNPEWKKDFYYNQMFLKGRENYLNDLLIARKHLFLNEALDQLGFERVYPEGNYLGWIYDPDNNEIGDNYIDLGLHDFRRQPVRDFHEGLERSIWIDFNFDGYILDRV